MSGNNQNEDQNQSSGCWYVLQLPAGREKKVAKLIQEKIIISGLKKYVFDIVVPCNTVHEMRGNKKVSIEKSLFPGYVLVNLIFTNEVCHAIRTVPGVYGFLGGNKSPKTMSDSEVERLLLDIKENKIHTKVKFNVGDQVQICDGPFSSFSGFVESINEDKERLVILVSIFDRKTPVELEYNQVEKII